MNLNKTLPLFLSTLLLVCSILEAEQLGDLKIQEIPDGTGVSFIVRNSQEAILIVHSTLPQLSFESNMGIIRVDNPDPGEYRVHLTPGTNIVTFKTKGYLPAKQRFYIEAKSYAEVRITPLRESITESRPYLRLKYTPSQPDEKILGSLDDNILHLDFSRSLVVLRPIPGQHSIRLNNAGRVWEQEINLNDEETLELTVEFPDTKTEDFEAGEPGSLFLTSTPSGAMVYFNNLEQGRTPLTLEDVQPGNYQIDLNYPLYLPEHFVIDVEPLDYTTHHLDLIPDFGNLEINSEPSGALVSINGQEKGLTPYLLPQINSGSHRLQLSRALFYDFEEQIDIAPGDTIKKQFTLAPKFGSISFSSVPTEAEIYLDGVLLGSTPMKLDTLPSGKHLITLRAPFYQDLMDEVILADAEAMTKDYVLQKDFGLLNVITDPAGAEVTIVGQKEQTHTSPIHDLKVNPGQYQVLMTKHNYEPVETSLMIGLGQQEILETSLTRLAGHLKISSNPQQASVFLNEEYLGTTPLVERNIPTGDYTLRLELSTYDLVKDSIRIEHQKITEFNTELSTKGTQAWLTRRKKARVMSLLLPGSGQYVSDQNIRGSIYMGTFVLFLAAAGSARNEYDKLENDYHSNLELYNNARDPITGRALFNEVNQNHADLLQKEEDLSSFLFLAFAIYAVQITDAWLWGGGEAPDKLTGKPRSSSSKLKMNFAPKTELRSGVFKVGFTCTLGGGR